MQHRTPLREEIQSYVRLLSEGRAEAAGTVLTAALATDSAAAVSWLKRMKVFFSPRSSEAFAELRDFALLSVAGSPVQVRRGLRRLLDEHQAILSPLWHLQHELDALPLWFLPRRYAVLLLALTIEAVIAESKSDLGRDGYEKLSKDELAEKSADQWNRQHADTGSTRALLDAGVSAFREILGRCPHSHTNYREVYEQMWLVDLLRLSHWREFLQGAIDRYAYFDWNVTLGRGEPPRITLRPHDEREEQALFQSSQRAILGDQQQHVELGVYEAQAAMRSRRAELSAILCPGNGIKHDGLLTALPDPWERLKTLRIASAVHS